MKENNSQEHYYYPKNFNIINKNVYLKMLSLFHNIFDEKIIEELKLLFCLNKGKILLKHINNNFFKEKEELFFIYECSLNKNNQNELEYITEKLISFDNKSERDKYFDIIINRENITKINDNNFKFNNNKYEGKFINIIKDNEFNKNKQLEFSSEENNKKAKENIYIKYAIILSKFYSSTEFYPQARQKSMEFYLINKKYMDELKEILHFKEIDGVIKKSIETNKIKKLEFKGNDDIYNNKIIDLIKGLLIEKTVNELRAIKEENIQNKFNNIRTNKNEFKNNNNSEKLYYYNNCQIISNEVLEVIKMINKKSQINLEKCYLSENKIFSRIYNNIINIGKFDNNKNYIVENILYSYYDSNISYIFNFIISKGYEELKKYKKENLNKYILPNRNNSKVEVKIFNITETEKANNDKNKSKDNSYKISEKLKTLLLFSINQYKFNNISVNDIKNEKVYLINKKWLEMYKDELNEINNVMNKNNKIKEDLKKFNNKTLELNAETIKNFISKIDSQSLKKIDEKLKTKNFNITNTEYEKIHLIKKSIIIYKDFILLNHTIYNNIKNNFNFNNNSILNQNIYYSSHKNKDIITIENDTQHTILLGNINKDNYTFNVQYILEFNSIESFNDEKNIILGSNIDMYIKNKMIFDKNKNDDLISPILSKNKLIGYCYIYKSNVDYNNCMNYYDLLSNKKINNSKYIYFNYQRINEKLKLNKIKVENEKYYLINKEFITDLKINNEFKRIYEIMESNDVEEKDDNYTKKFLIAIKNLSKEDLKLYNEKNNSILEYSKFIPNLIQKNYSEGNIFLYDNFEIFHKDIIEKLIDIKQINNFYYLDCIVNEGKIILNYPDNSNENKNKFISVIGSINNEKTFMTEYLLIYKEKNDKSEHIKSINGCLTNYLKNLKFCLNRAPIVEKKCTFKEIGVIIRYNEITGDITNNNNNVNISTGKEKKKKINAISQIPIKPKNIQIKSVIDISEYNLDFQTNTPFIRNYFKFPPKIGLQNIGATCYMNATLQCFCHIEKFINFFKYNHQVVEMVRKDRENNLTSSFKLLIEKLWPGLKWPSNNNYAPEEFKKKISKMNPLFEGIAANDSKDLVNFIIMTLHEELNKANKNNNIINNVSFLDQTNQQLMFNNFAQNFMLNNKSIISDLFYGINCNITQCGGCGIKTYNYQTYFFIVFPLEEVRKYKYNNNQFNNFNNYNIFNNYNNNFNNINNNVVTIFDCFDYDRKVNIMSGNNSMYCNYCKRNCNSSMCTLLTTSPEILILLLNRGKGNEFNVKILFSEILNLYNYIQFNNTGFNYKLIGVITHIGESSMSGHFIAYCRDPIFDIWHKYNDSIVSDVNNFQNEVINFATPYLLFYQKFQ